VQRKTNEWLQYEIMFNKKELKPEAPRTAAALRA
jgi:hypothetical protein